MLKRKSACIYTSVALLFFQRVKEKYCSMVKQLIAYDWNGGIKAFLKITQRSLTTIFAQNGNQVSI